MGSEMNPRAYRGFIITEENDYFLVYGAGGELCGRVWSESNAVRLIEELSDAD